ncbi:MAG TPA: KUP/HAK/KT family potassium transporter [Opitutaceae bacterium]|jgi:KUP system potassium uptake protein|nr:KUP/HAK/KT family potassium transporter [Opitutaceae bacterium]
MHASAGSNSKSRVQLGLSLGALGIVFGDIGTSPLYTMRECIKHLPPVEYTDGILGVLSLMFWALMFVVSFKYMLYVTRADNHGEGGIFALLALSYDDREQSGRRRIGIVTIIIMIGAALLFGDGVITPAISVLGAAEGFTSFSQRFTTTDIVIIACVILAALFWFQHKGTKAIGTIFGPIMLVWFATLGVLGARQIIHAPQVWHALDPRYGLALLFSHPNYLTIAELLGAVVLCITGAEALYADLGHFGRQAIGWAWFGVACPGLLLNYFGQGALLLTHKSTPDIDPFFGLAPAGTLRLGLVILSIVAAVIASQALISGTYSLARQAIQLGFFPRLKIAHTNPDQPGQIYVPLMNQMLAIGALAVVLGFRSSANLAAAYGIAVTGTMAVTTFAFYRVIRYRWNWSWLKAAPLCTAFLIVDIAFFASNLHKIADGGWLPLTMALGVLAIMHTWKSGRNEILEKVYSGAITELELSNIAKSKSIVRVPGSAVFMAGTPKGTPLALLHHLKANKSLQRTVVLLTITTKEVPQVPEADRLTIEDLGEGVWRAIGRFGYMESPDVSMLVTKIQSLGVPIKPQGTTFFFNREMIISGGNARMWEWEKRFYGFLSRNATPVKDYYNILPTQIIEIGLPVQL